MANNKKDSLSTCSPEPTRLATALAEALAPLANVRIPVQNWSTAVISSVPLSVPDFIKTISILSPYKDIGSLGKVFVIGLLKNQLPTLCYNQINPLELYKFCKWLQTAEARPELDKIPWPEEVSATEVLQHQMQDMKAHLKSVTNDFESRINDLKVQIAIEESKMANALSVVRAQYVPACDFQELGQDELIQRCREKYKARCGTKCTYIDDRTARRDFEEGVKQQHAIPFVRQKVVRDALCNFLKRKLDETIDLATDLEEVRSFSKHLKVMNGEIVEQETSGKTGSATVVHSNRKP